ncbi:MAG: aminotransferase class III-fold pyridoxal phosphate-dependent enzyme [Pirellulaceae bacterium]
MASQDSAADEDWLRRWDTVTPTGSRRAHDPCYGPVFVRGEGSCLWDSEGHTWIDLTCGFSATNFGHAHPRLLQALQQQASELGHVTGDPHPRRIELAELIASKFQRSAEQRFKTNFSTSGARAVEAAWKIASSLRPGKLIALAPSLHGRSIATSILSSTKRIELSESLASRTRLQPVENYPYCVRCPLGKEFPSCETACGDDLFSLIECDSGSISGVLVEPALTARGYVFPPAEWFLRLREVTAKANITLIADEIQTGMGRCGGLLLSQQQGWPADLTLLGKSLGGGLTSIACVVGTEAFLDRLPPGVESETGAANPIACAVALEAIRILEEDSLIERGVHVGKELRRICSELLPASLTRIEGQAACCAIEFLDQEAAPGHDCQLAQAFASACASRRLKVHLTGPLQTRVVLLPPLVMTDDELYESQRRLTRAAEIVNWSEPFKPGKTDD